MFSNQQAECDPYAEMYHAYHASWKPAENPTKICKLLLSHLATHLFGEGNRHTFLEYGSAIDADSTA